MSQSVTPSATELERLDRFYREGGLRAMASPHVHFDDPLCPHDGCSQQLEWIDFKLEVFNDSEGVEKPLARSWWEGTGFAGRCPRCHGWIRFTTLRIETLDNREAEHLPRLPDDWHTVAQFA